MPKTRKLALMAMFTAASLIVFVIEAQIPAPIPVPGVKLGLANIVTLIAMVMLGRREAGLILLVRIAMGSMFTGGVSAFIFSIAGGALAYAVMCLTLKPFSGKLLWVISVLGAIAHNLGQLIANYHNKNRLAYAVCPCSSCLGGCNGCVYWSCRNVSHSTAGQKSRLVLVWC